MSKNNNTLSQSFYKRDTETVARALLGKLLVHRLSDGTRLSGIIVETEAYLGINDKACHTFGGRKTERTRSMYLEGGHAYIYFIYGMYFCFNVVTQNSKKPEAVLIRAIEPFEGIDRMKKLRKQQNLHSLASGPGKLCQALKITRNLDGQNLITSNLTIEMHQNIPKKKIVCRPRIGINYAEEATEWPLRFYIKNNTFISKP